MATRPELEAQALGLLGGGNLNIPIYPYQDVYQGYEDTLRQQNADLAGMSDEAWGWVGNKFLAPEQLPSPYKIAAAKSGMLAAAESELKKKQEQEAMMYDLAESIARKSPQGRFAGGRVNSATAPVGSDYLRGMETPPADMQALEDLARAKGLIKEDPTKVSDFERQQKALRELGATPEELKQHASQGHSGFLSPKEAVAALNAIALHEQKRADNPELAEHPLTPMIPTLREIAAKDKNATAELSKQVKQEDHYKQFVGKQLLHKSGVKVKVVGVVGDKLRVRTAAGREGTFPASDFKGVD